MREITPGSAPEGSELGRLGATLLDNAHWTGAPDDRDSIVRSWDALVALRDKEDSEGAAADQATPVDDTQVSG